MIGTVIRTLIIYCVLTLCVRLMGKRQLGELQPGELVITILMSEIAANPIEDSNIPLINCIVPLMLLVSFEIFNSLLDMKNVRFRLITEGNPRVIIRNGELDQKQLKKLRFTVSDVLAALRQKDVFDIADVQYAIVEANGMLSVLLKPDKRTATPKTVGKPEKDNGMPCPVIIDGKIIKNNFLDCGVSVEEIERKIARENTSQKDIVLMTVDKNKQFYIIKRENTED